MVRTLIDVLQQAASVTSKGFTFLDDRLSESVWSFADLSHEAARRARIFRTLGLKQGDRVALIVPDGEDFVLTFIGAVRAGLVPVPMYPPLALGKLDAYVDAAARILESSGARILVTSKAVAPIVWSLVGRVPTLEDLVLVERLETFADAEITATLDGIHIEPEDPAFLQFTSGSTAEPKGVIVSHGNLVANSKAIMIDGLRSHTDHDRGVSWLPLYHDMGLIGFVIAPMLNHVPVVFMPTLSFVKRPHIWMETVAKYRGTITFAPNFAFGLAAKRAQGKKLDYDLSCLRVLGCGAEPINAKTMRTFMEAFAPAGLRKEAIMPCYGMAEATLAISFDDVTKPFRTVVINRAEYEEYNLAVPYPGLDGTEVLELVSCGRTFPGHEVAVINQYGAPLPEGEVGEIVMRGPSITGGYFQNEEATRALLEDGWLHTGDLGFFLGGELFVSGRKKDLIILNGRNYHPQAFEWEVEQIDGVRKGNVVAFSRAGENSEELVIVAEVKEHQDRTALANAVRNRIHETSGVRVREVVLLDAGGLPKTSSGKLQRKKTAELYFEGTIGGQGNRTLGSTATKVALARHVTKSAFARVKHSLKKGRKLVPFFGWRAESESR
jgi:fatty-acyl-CoA synthase